MSLSAWIFNIWRKMTVLPIAKQPIELPPGGIMSRKSFHLVSVATLAMVQAAHAADSVNPPLALDEVVVIANKRAEKIEDVPSSVLAVTADQLEQQNVRNFEDLVNVAPNLTLTKASQPGNNSINMRGIGTYSISIASQPSVAVVVDDIPLALQAEAFSALVGVQQIEVLRGPQSTLFGKSADAGVIVITRPRPAIISRPRPTPW